MKLRTATAAALALGVLAFAPGARAQDAAATPRGTTYGHASQAEIRAAFGTGWRFALGYGKGKKQCPDDDDGKAESFCTARTPAFTDLEIGFGASDGLEVTGGVRLGLEDLNDDPAPLALGLGIRAYTSPLSAIKFYIGARGIVDLTSGQNTDFALRAEPGLQFELLRSVALSVQTGVTLGLVRWLRFEVDGALALQYRF